LLLLGRFVDLVFYYLIASGHIRSRYQVTQNKEKPLPDKISDRTKTAPVSR
jgi:hypothetical protein